MIPHADESQSLRSLFFDMIVTAQLRDASLPIRERVLDRLADLMFDADDLLHMLKAEDTRHDFRWLEPDVRHVYENVNTLMKSLCD